MNFEKIKRKLKNNWRKLKRVPNSVILCVRFPFLYPRNTFNDLHYSNWKIQEKINDLYSEAFTIGLDSTNEYKAIVTNYGAYIGWKLYRFYYKYILQILHCVPTYTELDQMDIGWRKAFGIQMCKEIKKALLKTGGLKLLFGYRIIQIKEKWGMLRWEDAISNKEIQDIIDKYERLSYKTCVVCGKPATKLTLNWICPYCDEHIGDMKYTEIKND